ncbi:alginate export family protein [Sulfurimonas autotrophica]|uniref:Alginate export domain-containing protein n=1 Tax=Sulfurimonas autotrophica (strain ATCC BAA-671 / DSM 16294 / JCM 11897 / OK10) TaxID=563040 RepID=E0UP75_SULAO|nr:alginate export family protein [Sulfurimonas autotrophica]ADN08539.1 conserved hypothetical protein [Sulfurimonas autotrophica DSM 16294]
MKNILLLLSLASFLYADGLSVVGSLRERVESWSGFNKKAYGDSSIDANGKKVGDSNDAILLQRIMLGGEYKTSNIDYSLIMYDAREWGSSLADSDFIKNKNTPYSYAMNPYHEHFELYDASLTFKSLGIQNLSFKVGRQDIAYGDKRIIGPGSWGNTIGWLWDAGRFSYKFDENFIDAWYGRTRTKDPNKFSMIEKHLYEGAIVYSHFQTILQGVVEPFYVYKHSLIPKISSEQKSYEYLNYAGARLYENDYKNFTYDVTYVNESGKEGSQKINDFAYIVKGGYQFKTAVLKPKIVLGRVYAGKDFTTPFGSTDGSHYGRMDLINWANMQDNQIALYLYPTSKINTKFTYHDFSLADASGKWAYYGYVNKSGYLDKKLGDEIDAEFFYKPVKNIKVSFIYAYFKAGAFVKNSVADNNAQHLFLQFEYKL